MRFKNISQSIALGLVLGSFATSTAFAQNVAGCSPQVYQSVVKSSEAEQQRAANDAADPDLNELMKAIKESPSGSKDKMLSCVLDQFPDINYGSYVGINMEPILKNVQDKVVDAACEKQRDLIRQADSAFSKAGLKGVTLSDVTSGNITDSLTNAAQQAAQGAVKQAGQQAGQAVSGAVNNALGSYSGGAGQAAGNAAGNAVGNAGSQGMDKLFKGGKGGGSQPVQP